MPLADEAALCRPHRGRAMPGTAVDVLAGDEAFPVRVSPTRNAPTARPRRRPVRPRRPAAAGRLPSRSPQVPARTAPRVSSVAQPAQIGDQPGHDPDEVIDVAPAKASTPTGPKPISTPTTAPGVLPERVIRSRCE